MTRQARITRSLFRYGSAGFCVLVCVLGSELSAHGRTLIGKKAASHIGDLQKKLTGSEYYAVVLERRNEERLTGNRVDAVIFSPLCRTYRLIRSLDQDHAVMLNDPSGKPAERVTAENVTRYKELIRENSLDPEVIFDKDGRLNLEVRKYLLQEERDYFLRMPGESLQQQ